MFTLTLDKFVTPVKPVIPRPPTRPPTRRPPKPGKCLYSLSPKTLFYKSQFFHELMFSVHPAAVRYLTYFATVNFKLIDRL